MTENANPQDLAAERAVLGSILISPAVIDRVAGLITPDSFTKDAHREIWRAMYELAISGKTPDLISVVGHVRDSGAMTVVGSAAYISSLTDGIPDIIHAEQHAERIREKATLRGIVSACQTATRSAIAGESSVDIVSLLQRRLSGVGVAESRQSRGIYTVVAEVRREADQRKESGEMVGVQTGFAQLDEMTLGIPREALSVLGGKSSHGKTTLAVNLVLSALEARDETRVVLYSLEMSKQAISDALRARISGVPLPAIREWKNLNAVDHGKVIEAESELAQYNSRFFFADRISTLSELVADARKRHQESGIDLVVVDYLQLLEGIDEETRERTVNQIAWNLAELAKDLKVAALALSQVTTAADQRKDGRLSIDDLRDSKAIGHHARLVLLMSRPWQSNKTRTDVLPCHTLLQVEKQSQGPTGDIPLHFAGATQHFREGVCFSGCSYARKSGGMCGECLKFGRIA